MSKKILIVDDEQNIRKTLKQCLANEGYDIDIAVNGEEALKKIKDDNFDLVLLDIKMPGMNGMEVLNKLRERKDSTNVVMMTAYGTVERAVEAMKLGAIDFLSKPFTPEEIRNLVKKIFGRAELEENKLKSFEDLIEFSKRCIINKDYGKAKKFLKKSLLEDVDSPEPYNLLGAINESNNHFKKATKYYRAALDMDPSYEPAQRNLERITEFKYSKKGMDLGEEDEQGET
ncbi:MAG: response regulator [Candidatus Humimicrobiaceae bacterium]